MTKKILLGFILASTLGFGQAKIDNGRLQSILSDSKQEFLNQESSIPGFIQFKTQSSPALSEVSSIVNSFSKNSFDLTEVSRENDPLGFTHIKYQQTVNSIPFELNFLTVHQKNGVIESVSGNLISEFPKSFSPSVLENDALSSALRTINADTYKWEVPEEEEFIKDDTEDVNATFYPNGELVFLQTRKGVSLAYKFNIYAHKPVSRADYYVDARTGKLLFKQGVFRDGTNNVGEFLALVHGLAFLKKNQSTLPIYSDSRTAIAWVRKKKNNSTLKRTSRNEKLFTMMENAEKWLKENEYETQILKWETKVWGEIPADFGRK